MKKPNKQFAEYVRSGAFQLNLSERMVFVLLAECGMGAADERLNIHPYDALRRRGLLAFKHGEGFTPTPAGRKVAELLRIAGYERK